MREHLVICHGLWLLQSSGTDSTVNLWLTSTNHDELTTERSLLSCDITILHFILLILVFSFICAYVLAD